jgi:uncharacterized protein YjiS (DUF1127 family)
MLRLSKSADAPGTSFKETDHDQHQRPCRKCRRPFSAFVAFCADFCAGARQGQEIADRYRELSRKSTPELNKLGLTRSEIPRAALTGTRH